MPAVPARQYRHLVAVLISAAACLAAGSASAGFLDDLPDLQGKTIAYAGGFEQVTCPIGGKYDCLKWPSELYKTTRGREICFVPTSYTSCSYSCKGVIAVDKSNTLEAFFIAGICGDMKKTGIEMYKCPSLF